MSQGGGISAELQESIQELLGKKIENAILYMIRVEVKTDRFENRVLVLNQHRLYLLLPKVPSKAELSIHFLDLQKIESRKNNQVTLVSNEGRKVVLCTVDADSEDVNRIITHIGVSLKTIFPSAPLEKMIPKIEVTPSDRLKPMQEQFRNKENQDPGPCGGFTSMYACMCDLHNLPFMEDVAWDVDTIYLSHDTRELSLGDFDHLDTRHLVPIISALEYNPWFTKLNASNIKLTTEAANEILRVMKKNNALEELHLSNIGVKWEFAHKLAMALLSNPSSPITTVNLSNNYIEDRGLSHLCSPISKLSRGLVHLNLAKTGISAKGVNRLAESLCSNRFMPTTLKVINLSDNLLKGEEITMTTTPPKVVLITPTNLYNFLAQPNAITTLNLSGTECALDNIFGALQRGCQQTLEHLDLSRNAYSHKRSREVVVPGSWRQFFSGAVSLKYVNLSASKLPHEAMKMVLLGLTSNQQLHDMHLDLSSNDLKSNGAQVLEACITFINNVSSLDISDNGFDADLSRICKWVSKNRNIKHLAIGRNFYNVKPKNLPVVLESIVQMIQEECSGLCSLSIAESKLKSDTTQIINSLGTNSSLTEIDISGNLMGDIGARMLAKALQINTKLTTVYWDGNATTGLGFADIAAALNKNFTLRVMPTPVNDAIFALRTNPEKTETALQQIERLLQRNHSPKKFATDQAYRLHQGFLISSAQQMVDKLVVQIQDNVKTLEKGDLNNVARKDISLARSYIGDADRSKQVLPRLQQVALQSEDDSSLVDVKLQNMARELQTAIEEQLKRNVSDMLGCAEEQCSTVLEEEALKKEIHSDCVEKSAVPKDFTKDLIIEQVGTDVVNKVSELNLAVAAHMSDRLIDGLLDSLDACQKTLMNHVNAQAKGELKEDSPVSPEPTPVKTMDLLSPDSEAPMSTLKRKTMNNRRLRPQSVLDIQAINDAESKDSTDGRPLSPVPGSPAPSLVKSPLKASKSQDSYPDLGPLPLLTAATAPLEHLGKQRPKRPKTHIGRKAVIQSENVIDVLEANVDSGVDSFFDKPEVEKQPIMRSPSHDSALTQHSGNDDEAGVSKQDSTKKKGWSPFGKAESKSLAAGITNFFSKKEKTSPSPRSPELGRRTAQSEESRAKSPEVTLKPVPSSRNTEPKVGTRPQSSPEVSRRSTARTREERNGGLGMYKAKSKEDLDKDTEDSKSGDELDASDRGKKPVAGQRFGLPGMSAGIGGSSLLAEMKLKKANSAKATAPSPPKDEDNKENRGSTGSEEKKQTKASHPYDNVTLRNPSSQLAPGKPVPAPRGSSPGKPITDKTKENEAAKEDAKKDDSSKTASTKARPQVPTRPKPPPPVAPKPRASKTQSVIIPKTFTVAAPPPQTSTSPTPKNSSTPPASTRTSGRLPYSEESVF